MPKNPLLLVITTCATQKSSKEIASTLIQESLAACVNIVPGVQSYYQWQGQLQQEDELILLIKCQPQYYSALEKRLGELHPYEVPEIIALPISEGLPAYLNWACEHEPTI